MRTLNSLTFLVLCILLSATLSAQSYASVDIASIDESSEPVYLATLPGVLTPTPSVTPMFRVLPTLAEGQVSIASFLRNTIIYPEIAVDNAIEGTMVISLTVTAAGTVSEVEVIEPLFGPIDQLVVASAKGLPRLAPAVFNGKAIKKELRIPIQFSLQ